ncbi:MAG TPA: trimeric intracellular cation channel family protein [Candidatus Deferrimicrobiaceae bacterium]|nr:trimeric intracellular cation channel family protein [Candidatus Deferrimicrobiaceae bacterium]
MNTLIRTIEVLGIIAFALTGFFAARKKGMDLIGVYSLGMVTALGGGSLRDILLNRHPLFWMEHYEYAILLLALSITSSLVAQEFFERKSMVHVVLALDALGLGSFSASGASLADQQGCALFVSSLLGVITGVFGGVMRDIVCNELPYVFQRTELYATCSFIGAWTYLLVVRSSGNDIIAATACIAVTFVLRMIALKYKIKLPI